MLPLFTVTELEYEYAQDIHSILTMLLIFYIFALKKNNINISQQLKSLKDGFEFRVSDEVNKQLSLEKQKSDIVAQLIGGLAHQWKQPLNHISTTCCHLNLKTQLCNKFDKELYYQGLCDIDKQTHHLSKTIDIFKNYIKGDRVYKKSILQDEIKQALVVSSTILSMNYIKVVDNIDYNSPIYIYLVTGELSQALINIINNAKDAMVQNNIENPMIKYNLIEEKNRAIVTIEDNAGGIREDIMSKIFEPYFTTKSENDGTGLGLDISKRIVTKDLKGKIYVQNVGNGAKFFIELPLLSTEAD